MTRTVPQRRQRTRAHRGRGEEGFADFVICLPVFFLLVIVGIQFALWSHAAHLARAAAEQGSQVASGYGSSAHAGTQAAYQFIATTGPGTLTGAQVSTTTLSGDTAQVIVTRTGPIPHPLVRPHRVGHERRPHPGVPAQWLGDSAGPTVRRVPPSPSW